MGRLKEIQGGISVPQLHIKWEKEKGFYEVGEVGTGVQIFVKDVIKSPDIFGLKVGLNSTKLENRKNEFLEERKSKDLRRPDITIYMTPEIIIPVEVEKYQNINAGKDQLLQYQVDFDKKYGILTDGDTWRFYINNVYTQYSLKTILGKTEVFLEFWREYTKPEKYYLSFFEEPGQRSLLKETELLAVEENRQVFFEDITKLIKSFKNKLDIEQYLTDMPAKERAKTAVEITYAYIIQFILYKTLVDNRFDEFPKQYEILVESIHNYLKENRLKDILGSIDNISAEISKNIYRPFSSEQNFIADRLLELYRSPQNELRDVSPWLDIFVFIKKYNFAEVRNEIFGYIYENYLKAQYEDQNKGQYFTDPAVVNFMLEQVGYTPDNLRDRISTEGNTISLIDPACGSGTFLYSAVDALIKAIGTDTEQSIKLIEELVNKDIFGLDIAEFPLYLAEMNILMRMLPLIINEQYNNPVEKKLKVFKTRDSIAEFMDTALRNTIHDIDVAAQQNNGQGFLFKEKLDLGYASYVRNEDDLKEMKESLESRPCCLRRRFDFVISNPPYIGYNESSKQGILILKLIKSGKNKLADLNNIYGVNLHSTPLRTKKSPPKPNLYAFFIALGLALLKDNAVLCYIIPQTILTAGDLDVIRYHLAKFTTIEKIITFSGKMFLGRGLKQHRPVPTSSLIFVVRRKYPDKQHCVKIINCKDVSDELETMLQNIRQDKMTETRKLLQGKLLENVSNWSFIKQEKSFLDFSNAYRINTDSISIYYNHSLAQHNFKSKFYFDIGYNIDETNIQDKPAKETKNYEYPKINSKYYSIRGRKGYYPNIKTGNTKFKIKLLKNNQGYNLLDSNHKVIWSYINFIKFHFTSLPVIWARNQICGIGSNNKNELLYLFSILNSAVTNKILESNLKAENEKDYLVSIASVKEFVRVPKIAQISQFIKDEIIKRAEEMLGLEEVKLADLVDFSRVLMQKFDSASVSDNNLILYRDKKQTRLRIKSNPSLIQKTTSDKYETGKMEFEKGLIKLSELKSLPVIDFDRQAALKDYIDDLVFALYFNVPLTKVGLEYTDQIKKLCKKSNYYILDKERKKCQEKC